VCVGGGGGGGGVVSLPLFVSHYGYGLHTVISFLLLLKKIHFSFFILRFFVLADGRQKHVYKGQY